ncbi:MAG: hypothetical protein ABIH46_02240, partial [Chloroflexota bacterium]
LQRELLRHCQGIIQSCSQFWGRRAVFNRHAHDKPKVKPSASFENLGEPVGQVLDSGYSTSC